ncbi:MAG: GTPase Era [bacterium]
MARERENERDFKSGFVAIVGRPNVGKSTLLNRLVGERLAIISEKPQTTRNRITGILTGELYQIIFLDTPGIHMPRDKLGEYMVGIIRGVLRDADVAVGMVEAGGGPDEELLRTLDGVNIPKILAINKVDTVAKETLLPLIDAYSKRGIFEEIFPISATQGDNVDELLEGIVDRLPPGEMYYDADTYTDQTERFIVAEIIREKIFQETSAEIPYASAVKVEELKRREGGGCYIEADIFVEKDSQKGIVIGKGGAKLKRIGERARPEIELFLGCDKVYLKLWVKVRKNWRKDEEALRWLGYI